MVVCCSSRRVRIQHPCSQRHTQPARSVPMTSSRVCSLDEPDLTSNSTGTTSPRRNRAGATLRHRSSQQRTWKTCRPRHLGRGFARPTPPARALRAASAIRGAARSTRVLRSRAPRRVARRCGRTSSRQARCARPPRRATARRRNARSTRPAKLTAEHSGRRRRDCLCKSCDLRRRSSRRRRTQVRWPQHRRGGRRVHRHRNRRQQQQRRCHCYPNPRSPHTQAQAQAQRHAARQHRRSLGTAITAAAAPHSLNRPHASYQQRRDRHRHRMRKIVWHGKEKNRTPKTAFAQSKIISCASR